MGVGLFVLPAFASKDGPLGVKIQFRMVRGKLDEQIKREIIQKIECTREQGVVSSFTKKFAPDGTGHICVQFKSDESFMNGLLLIQKTIRDHVIFKSTKDWQLKTGITTMSSDTCDEKSLEDFEAADQTLDRNGEESIAKDPCNKK